GQVAAGESLFFVSDRGHAASQRAGGQERVGIVALTMCGISAIVNFGDSSEAVSLLGRLHAPIRHRGPDGEGFLVIDSEHAAHRFDRLDDAPSGSARVLCGFRRLKILDLTEAAAQPMRTIRGNAWLTFNGEIYNYRELREELLKLGH